jgi:hypothetical protein
MQSPIPFEMQTKDEFYFLHLQLVNALNQPAPIHPPRQSHGTITVTSSRSRTENFISFRCLYFIPALYLPTTENPKLPAASTSSGRADSVWNWQGCPLIVRRAK